MSEPLSPAQVAEIRARAEQATPGPWGSKCNRKYCHDGYHAGHAVRNDRNYRKGEPLHEDGSIGQQIAEIRGGGGSHKCDADFISHARTDVPALCDSYDAQAREIERLKAGASTVARGYEQTIKERNDEVARLKQERGELRADKERLAKALHVFAEIPLCGAQGLPETEFIWTLRNAWLIEGRAAIDAARTAQQGKP